MCLVIVLALPLNLAAHYGFAGVDYFPASERAY